MQIIKVLEHNGIIFNIGDEIEVKFDNGNKARGKIKEFDTYGFMESGLEDGITFGKYCIPFSDITDVKKIQKKSDEIMNFAVSVLAEVAECAIEEDSPLYKRYKEVDYFVKLSDVENSINKYLKEQALKQMGE